jgi:hypothetical protein
MAARHFVVREEGGEYEFMSKRRWQRERPFVPIFGVRTPEGMVAFDRITLGLSGKPLRMAGEWPRRVVPPKHRGLGDGEGQAGWKDGRYLQMRDWSPAAVYLRENFR